MREVEQVRPLTFPVWALARLLQGAARALYATLRMTVRGEAETDALLEQHGGVILVTWHGQSLIPVVRSRGRGYIGLVSLSRDGDLLAEFLRQLGWRTIRGSTRRGGVRAMKMAIRALSVKAKTDVERTDRKAGAMLAVTPDGPRGPARRVQPGTVVLARISGKPLVPVGIGVDRAWQAKSWDRFTVPKPFSRVVWLYGEPIWVGHQADIMAICSQVEEAINTVEAEAMTAARKQERGGRYAREEAHTPARSVKDTDRMQQQ